MDGTYRLSDQSSTPLSRVCSASCSVLCLTCLVGLRRSFYSGITTIYGIPHSVLLPIPPPGTSSRIWQLHKQFYCGHCMSSNHWHILFNHSIFKNAASLHLLFPIFVLRANTSAWIYIKWHCGHYTWEGNSCLKNELPVHSRCINLAVISEVPILLQAAFCSAPSCMLVSITLPSIPLSWARVLYLKVSIRCPYPE